MSVTKIINIEVKIIYVSRMLVRSVLTTMAVNGPFIVGQNPFLPAQNTTESGRKQRRSECVQKFLRNATAEFCQESSGRKR